VPRAVPVVSVRFPRLHDSTPRETRPSPRARLGQTARARRAAHMAHGRSMLCMDAQTTRVARPPTRPRERRGPRAAGTLPRRAHRTPHRQCAPQARPTGTQLSDSREKLLQNTRRRRTAQDPEMQNSRRRTRTLPPPDGRRIESQDQESLSLVFHVIGYALAINNIRLYSQLRIYCTDAIRRVCSCRIS
jgi:hypothetical protein